MTAGTLTVTTPSDCEIAMSRVFDARRSLVFEALTKPEWLQRWLGIRAGWTMPVCEMDLTVGGAYRWLWRGPDGAEMGVRGIYRVVTPPHRLIATERFDQPWYPGEAVVMIALAEQGSQTQLTTTVRYESREARDGALKTPMTRGVAESYDLLAELLAAPPAA